MRLIPDQEKLQQEFLFYLRSEESCNQIFVSTGNMQGMDKDKGNARTKTGLKSVKLSFKTFLRFISAPGPWL